MSGYSDDEWEEIGQAWLHASGQGDRDRPDALQFVRWLKHAGYIRDYICVADADLPTADGKFNPEEARVYYRQSVWNAAERGVPHAVWTIWHEASHAIQKHQQERYRSNTARKSRLSSSTGKDEFEANRLAACLAAPFDKSGYCLGTTADDLCRKFNLSRPAGERRLVEFERMYRRKHNVRRELPADVFDFSLVRKRRATTFVVSRYREYASDAAEPIRRRCMSMLRRVYARSVRPFSKV